MRALLKRSLLALSVAWLSFAPLASAAWPPIEDDRGPATESRAALDQDAITAYRRGELSLAHDLWLSCLDAESADARTAPAERARVLYNLGNVAFRRGNVMEAVGWYTAALRLRPRDGDTWANLEHARSEAKLDPADRGDLTATLWRLLSSLTLAESEWLVCAALGVWALVLSAEALRGGRVWARLALGGVALVLVCSAPWVYNVSHADDDQVLVLGTQAPSAVEVRSEPRAEAAVIGEAPAGALLSRLDALPEWTKVELQSGLSGWVPERSVFALAR